MAEELNGGYRKIFWGIFFNTFHINLGNFQVLPAFLAILIMASGISMIEKARPSREILLARRICYVYAFFLLAVLAVQMAGLSGAGQRPELMGLDLILTGLGLILNIEVFFYLLTASGAYLEEDGMEEDGERYRRKALQYTVAYTLISILVLIAMGFFMEGFSYALALCGVLLQIWLMFLMSDLRKRFEADTGSQRVL